MDNSKIKLKRKVQLREKTGEVVNTIPNKVSWYKRPLAWVVIIALGVASGFCVWINLGKDNIVDKDSAIEQEKSIVENSATINEGELEPSSEFHGSDSVSQVVIDNTSKIEEEQSKESIEQTMMVSNDDDKSMSSIVNISNDVETEALKVIRGDYGIGQERKDKLGEKYQTIQTRVNELKREGLF